MIARSELVARDDRIAALQPADEAVVPEAPLSGDQSHLLVGAPEEVLGALGAGAAESRQVLAQLLEDRAAVAARLREVEERLTTLQQASTAAGEAEVRARELERAAPRPVRSSRRSCAVRRTCSPKAFRACRSG